MWSTRRITRVCRSGGEETASRPCQRSSDSSFESDSRYTAGSLSRLTDLERVFNMKLSDFLANDENPHRQAGNPSVKCNALYKNRQNFNCYLKRSEAIELAQYLLAKAKIILAADLDDAAIQVWNQGEHNEKIFLGLTKARQGARRIPKVQPDQTCPICSAEVEKSTRYPRYVCEECAAQASSADGRLLQFSNIDISGGYAARYADSGEDYASHDCYIAGTKCYADEAKFGGIVIEPAE